MLALSRLYPSWRRKFRREYTCVSLRGLKYQIDAFLRDLFEKWVLLRSLGFLEFPSALNFSTVEKETRYS